MGAGSEIDLAIRGPFGQIGIMTDHEDGNLARAGQLDQHLDDLSLGQWVKARGGLIGKQEDRFEQQRTRDGQALQFTARHFTGKTIKEHRIKPQALQQGRQSIARNAMQPHQILKSLTQRLHRGKGSRRILPKFLETVGCEIATPLNMPGPCGHKAQQGVAK